MQWPAWPSKSSQTDQDEKRKPIAWKDSLNKTDWSHYTDPRNLIPVVLLTSGILLTAHLHRTYLRRIPGSADIRAGFFRKRSLFGKVTRVGDGDGFRLFHTPGGRLTGWGWFPGRKVPVIEKKGDLKGKTISIRLAGVDAPELSHFGKPAQPYSGEALEWLKSYILNRRVRAYIFKRDQYDRVVAQVFVRRWCIRRDVGKEMLKAGLATVYEAKVGAEFGDFEEQYRTAEQTAKRKKKGMWNAKGKLESPREFKTRMAEMGGDK